MSRTHHERPRRAKLRAIVSAAIAALVLSSATIARADQQSELAKGQQLYTVGDHLGVDSFFAKAIDGANPTITDPVLVNKGRMLRASSDMYLGRKADAVTQFEEILKSNPKFEPDPLLFPQGVLDEFKKTRDRLEKEAADKAKGDKTLQDLKACRDSLDALGTKYKSLADWAARERVVHSSSRLVATIPFGAGQFQNGDTALGIVFLSTETVAVIAASISYAIHYSIPQQPADTSRAQSVESASRIVNLISVGAFAALAIGGVVQAHLAYVPETYEIRSRPLPKSFLSSLVPVVAAAPSGATFGIAATF
jgi:hypothetical protein